MSRLKSLLASTIRATVALIVISSPAVADTVTVSTSTTYYFNRPSGVDDYNGTSAKIACRPEFAAQRST